MKKNRFVLLLFVLSCSCAAFAIRQTCRQDLPYLTIIGGVNMADGLGRQSIEMMEAMKDSMKVGFIPTYIDNQRDIPESILPLLSKTNRKMGTVIFCQEPIGASFKKLRSVRRAGQIRIAYSMFESTLIPLDWVERLNTHFDLVAVPDPFLVEVYQRSGVKIPVFTLPLARNFRPFLDASLKSNKNTPFVFGSFGAGIGRKNQIGLIRAFTKAFQNRADVRLALHCRMCDSSTRESILQEIGKAEGLSIQFTEGSLDQASYLNFLKSIDCYVSPSKGEGFSIQPREAMALGIPTIVTDNTAQHTICQSGLVRVVASAIEEPALYEWRDRIAFGSFFSCEEEDLAEALLDVEQHYDHYLSQSSQARNWASQYHYEEIKPLYLTLFKPKKIIFGSENKIEPDFLMTSSESLYQKYRTLSRL